jgi:hypothetical protein
MNFSNISFPHPVLGINDDVLSEIKKIDNDDIIIISTAENYEIKIQFKFNDRELKRLIREDKAEFICEVTCSNTLYREIVKNKSPEIELKIPRKQVKGKVEFIFILVAKEHIYSYSNTNFHSDFKGFVFDIEKGEMLAYFGEFSFDADLKYEKLKAVSSFMEVVPNEELIYTYVDLKKDKIEIQLPLETYNIFLSDLISQEVKFVPIFHSSIVLNALTIALYNLDENREYLWAKVIDYRLKNEKQFSQINYSDKENFPDIAQMLLGNPFKRLLEGVKVIVESSENEE